MPPRLRRDTRLRASSSLSVKPKAGSVELDGGDGPVVVAPEALLLLSAFWQARTVKEALAMLRPAVPGRQGWAQAAGLVPELVKAGILRPEGGEGVDADATASFADATAPVDPRWTDDTELLALIEATRAVVTPGNFVVDLAPASGLVALSAAQCGATRVICAAHGAHRQQLESLFDSAGLRDRLLVVPAWPPADAPHPDLVLSERVGREPAVQTWLRRQRRAARAEMGPGSRNLPAVMNPHVQLVEVPSCELDRRFFTRANLEHWSHDYGIDFRTLGSAGDGSSGGFHCSLDTVEKWGARSGRVAAEVCQCQPGIESYSSTVTVPVTSAGPANAVAVDTDLHLTDSLLLSGRRAGAALWVQLIPEVGLTAGQRVVMTLSSTASQTGVRVVAR